MTKKIFVLIIAILLIFATSSVFAANEIKDSMDKTGSTVKNIVDGTGNVLRDTGAAISNGARNLGDDVANGAKNMGEAIGNGARDVGETINNGARDAGSAVRNGASQITGDFTRNDNRSNDNGGSYTVARTSTEGGTIMGMSANTWTWFILAITALAIIALVWYYAMENKNAYGKHHND